MFALAYVVLISITDVSLYAVLPWWCSREDVQGLASCPSTSPVADPLPRAARLRAVRGWGVVAGPGPPRPGPRPRPSGFVTWAICRIWAGRPAIGAARQPHYRRAGRRVPGPARPKGGHHATHRAGRDDQRRRGRPPVHPLPRAGRAAQPPPGARAAGGRRCRPYAGHRLQQRPAAQGGPGAEGALRPAGVD